MLIGTTLSMPLSQIKLLSNYKSLHAGEYLMPMLISEKLELHNELCFCCFRNRFARTVWCASTWRARTTPTAVTSLSTLATCQPASPRYSTRGFSVISAVEMVKLTVSFYFFVSQFWRTLAPIAWAIRCAWLIPQMQLYWVQHLPTSWRPARRSDPFSKRRKPCAYHSTSYSLIAYLHCQIWTRIQTWIRLQTQWLCCTMQKFSHCTELEDFQLQYRNGIRIQVQVRPRNVNEP